MVFHGIKTERWRGRTLLRMLLLGWRGISTFQLPLQLERCLSCQHSHHQMVPGVPICLGPRWCQGTGRWRTSASSWLWVWALQQTTVPPTLHLWTNFTKGFFFHSSEPANLQHNQSRAQLCGGKKHLFFWWRTTYFGSLSISLMSSWGFLLEEVHLILWCWVEPPSATPSILGTTRMCCCSATRAGNADVKEASWDNSSNIFLMIRSSCCHILHLLPWAKHLNLLHSSSSSMKQGNHSVLIVAISCLGEQ